MTKLSDNSSFNRFLEAIREQGYDLQHRDAFMWHEKKVYFVDIFKQNDIHTGVSCLVRDDGEDGYTFFMSPPNNDFYEDIKLIKRLTR